MKSLFIIGLVTFMNASSASDLGLFFNDPKAVSAYYSKTETHKGNAGTPFTMLDHNSRKTLCMKSFNTVHFSLVVSSARNVVPTNLGIDFLQNMDDVNAYFDAGVERQDSVTVKINLKKPGTYKYKEVDLVGIPCVPQINSWILMQGSDDSHYYVMDNDSASSSSSKKSYGNFVGLVVEDYATAIDWETSGTRQQLESAFLQSQNAIDDTARYDLDSFNQLRACSSIYTLWVGDAIDSNSQHFVRDAKNLKTQASFFKLSITMVEIDAIKVIPCAINVEMTDAQFYLTVDVTEAGAVYVLTKECEGHVDIYTVVMRVKNVLGL